MKTFVHNLNFPTKNKSTKEQLKFLQTYFILENILISYFSDNSQKHILHNNY